MSSYSVDNFYVFFIILATTVMFLFGSTFFIKRKIEIVTLALGLLGVFLYSGIGTLIVNVPGEYHLLYSIFIFFLCFSFILGTKAKILVNSTPASKYSLDRIFMKKKKIILSLFYLYYAVLLFRLIYPEFILFNLFSPPTPDSRAFFFERREEAVYRDFIVVVRDYLELLLFPFFLLGLFFYKEKFAYLIFFVVFYLYVNYVADEYIGRYKIVLYVLLIYLILWYFNKVSTWKLILFGSFSVVGFIYFYKMYGLWRLGVDITDIAIFDFGDSLNRLIEIELTYPAAFEKIYFYAGKVDLIQYLGWIITLPIPKVLIGSGFSIAINADISRLLFDQSKIGEGGTYIALVSFFVESFFIYGKHFFWVHALTVGFLFGALCQLLRLCSGFVIINLFFSLEFLLLSRGGVGSVFPVLFNNFILFYIFIFWLIYKQNTKHSK